MTSQLQNDLFELTRKQELTLNDLAIQEGERSYLQSQYEIVLNSIEDLQLDYEFASTELEDELICPVCGTIHENSMDSRLDFLKDKSKMEDLAKDLKQEISKYEHDLLETRKSLDDIKNDIKKLQDKYLIEDKDKSIDLENVIESYSSKSLRLKINTSRSTSLSAIHEIDIDIKSFKLDQKNTKNDQKDINRDFINYLIEFFQKVDVESLLSDKTKEPTDFKTLGKQGSEADKIRSRLAYYIALYNLINKHSQEIISPLIVDTPQQQDQSDKNYKSMLDLISNSTPEESQIFLCAVDKPILSDFKKKSHVVHVAEKQVISIGQFTRAKSVFDSFEFAILLS
ncbi:hypothetical protein BWI96_20865 [Siphonobacter sp. SORGH_AS_0500]|nr:hypothetical protein BWI96_20865 [Siphonobacter sp. SORGH_AS_0500]